jgi:hypothetical protein
MTAQKAHLRHAHPDRNKVVVKKDRIYRETGHVEGLAIILKQLENFKLKDLPWLGSAGW